MATAQLKEASPYSEIQVAPDMVLRRGADPVEVTDDQALFLARYHGRDVTFDGVPEAAQPHLDAHAALVQELQRQSLAGGDPNGSQGSQGPDLKRAVD